MIALPPTPDSETPQSPEPSSGNVVRKYTAPTCTLEIAANASVLARWTQKPTLKNQRFNLRFDDPRLGEDQWAQCICEQRYQKRVQDSEAFQNQAWGEEQS